MHSKEFLYLQYNELNWAHQAQTDLNGFINEFITDEIISVRQAAELKVFDIGFGIGAFIRMLIEKTSGHSALVIEGCEPSEKNYSYFANTPLPLREGVSLKTYPEPFLLIETGQKFDFITAIYVFPHIAQDELAATAKKIHSMLEPGGRFVMVVANEHYLKERLTNEREAYTLLEKTEIDIKGRSYTEFMHYTDIPGIGRILDYSRGENLYLDLFQDNGLSLFLKKDLEDSGYVCSVYVFQKD